MKRYLIAILLTVVLLGVLTGCVALSETGNAPATPAMYDSRSALIGSTIGSLDDIPNLTASRLVTLTTLTSGRISTTGNFAAGRSNVLATGATGSIAVGDRNVITGTYSQAFGIVNSISGNNSVAVGAFNVMSGLAADAFGDSNVVSGQDAFGIGASNVVTGRGSYGVGSGNHVDGITAQAFGRDSTVSGAAAMSLGNANNVSGQGAVALGAGNVVSGAGATAIGIYGVADKTGQFTFAVASFSGYVADGMAQTNMFLPRIAKTTHISGTWYSLYLDGYSAKLTLAADTAWTVRAQVVGLTAGAAQMWNYEVVCGVKNDGGTTSVQGNSVTSIYEADADYDVQCAADDTNDALLIQVRRANDTDYAIRWVATVWATQVGYPAP